jgi:predicted dehydrogenase
MKTMKNPITRREFLTTSVLATAAGLSLPAFTSCVAPSRPRVRRPAPSNRVNLAVIGYGTIALKYTVNFMRDDRVQVVAVADPVSDLPNYGYTGAEHGGRLVGQRAIEKYYADNAPSGAFKGCRPYEDFREMLDREDIDAVYIATPDHWHCAMALLAARKGKHIYSQKPLALTIAEGRRMADAVAAAGVTWQTGSQQRSSIYFRTACEFVRNGRLGRLQGIKIGIPGGRDDWSKLGARSRPETPPPGLNYDLWLGPAPQRDYTPALLQVNWRNNWDYSGGMVTDWGAHHLDILQWALDMDTSGPVAIENVTSTPTASARTFPTSTPTASSSRARTENPSSSAATASSSRPRPWAAKKSGRRRRISTSARSTRKTSWTASTAASPPPPPSRSATARSRPRTSPTSRSASAAPASAGIPRPSASSATRPPMPCSRARCAGPTPCDFARIAPLFYENTAPNLAPAPAGRPDLDGRVGPGHASAERHLHPRR